MKKEARSTGASGFSLRSQRSILGFSLGLYNGTGWWISSMVLPIFWEIRNPPGKGTLPPTM